MPPTRRDLLDLALRAAALPAAGPFFTEWLQAAQHHSTNTAPPQSTFLHVYKPSFFTPEDFAALRAFTEILIPTDETPGAREAYCAHYIDFVLQASSPQTAKQWQDAMSALKAAGFHAADAKGRASLLEAMSRPERDRNALHPCYSAYRLIKQQNTFAFYTSRAGMIETLDYKGNSYYATFPACAHPEHHTL